MPVPIAQQQIEKTRAEEPLGIDALLRALAAPPQQRIGCRSRD
jgi:hypothetical protein